MKFPSNLQLMGVAGAFGLLTGCTGLFFHSKMQQRFKGTSFVRESLIKLRKHEGACYLLGTPIKDFNIHFHDTENNYSNENEAIFKIPVKGPNGHGWYFIRAEPKGERGVWVGIKCELELDATNKLEKEKYEGKRLKVFDSDKEGFMTIDG